MSEHDPRWAVSASTYKNHACRCDGCRRAQADSVADSRRKSPRLGAVSSKRQQIAVRWIRDNHPDVYATLTEQAYAELGIERRPTGRPKAKP
jgi:hypothetical protein